MVKSCLSCKFAFFIFTLFFFACEGREVGVDVSVLNSKSLKPREAIPLILEHARNNTEIQWGLMGRNYLPKNQGMLFHFANPHPVKIWCFNCLIDLSVAFLDVDQVIREIYPLKAYPEKMDPLRPINVLSDMQKYSKNDPIILFFKSKGVASLIPASYALEMNMGWFESQHVTEGDVLIWGNSQNSGWIIPTLDISHITPTELMPVLIAFDKEGTQAVSLTGDSEGRDIVFLDKEKNILKMVQLKGGKKVLPQFRQVAYSPQVSYLLVAQPGWIKKNNLQIKDRIISK